MEETKRVHIVRGLRQIWMRSKERSEALKLAKYTCQKCGKKKSVAKGKEQKVEVHHKLGVGNWDRIVQVIRDELLCSPEHLEVLCPECHKLER
jgi:5-methylcytosine-specific restriction endonuclease McrA